MSYDLDLYVLPRPKCSTCGHGEPGHRVFDIDPTYNIGGIVRLADRVAFPGASERECGHPHGRSFGAIHRKTGTESLAWLKPVLVVLRSADHEKDLRKLEPDNGWGSLDGTANVFTKMIQAAEEHPDAAWSIMGDGDVKTDRDDDARFFGWTS